MAVTDTSQLSVIVITADDSSSRRQQSSYSSPSEPQMPRVCFLSLIASYFKSPFVARLLALYRESGSLNPRPLNNGRKPRLDAAMLDKIRDRVREQPDISLPELIDEFSLPVSAPALCKTLNGKLGLRRKKNGTRGGTASEGCATQTGSLESWTDKS